MAYHTRAPTASHADFQGELAAALAARQQPELDPNFQLLTAAVDYLHRRGGWYDICRSYAAHRITDAQVLQPMAAALWCLSQVCFALQSVPAQRQSSSSAWFRAKL
jgi:hypothetical protein